MAHRLPIPHREPFAFVTKVEAVYSHEGLFTYDMPKTGDSFSLRIFPELLSVEAMAQAAAAFHGLSTEVSGGGSGERGLLASVDKVRFNGRARPGDQLRVKIRRKKVFGDLVLLDGECWVHHRMVSQAELVVRRIGGGDKSESEESAL